jgi:hypothetical protein
MMRATVEIQRDPVSLGFLPSLTLLLLILLPVGATAGDEIHSTDRSGHLCLGNDELGIGGEAGGDVLEGLLHIVREEEIFVILAGNHAIPHDRLSVEGGR